MGNVFRATDRQTGAPVALKEIRGDRARAHSEARFLREAELLESLSHPAIVRYVAHGDHEGERFLVTEWIGGETLSQRIAAGPLTPREAVAVGREIGAALAVAHRHGIVHRDVKPGNIILRDAEVRSAVLIDFGVARAGKLTGELTDANVAIGTAAYMAPEQAACAEVDGRADLYALGAVLYHALAGVVPFPGPDLLTILTKIILQPPRPLRFERDDVPASLDELVLRMLRKDPSERPSTAELFLEELDAIDLASTGRSSIASIVLTGREQRLTALVVARMKALSETEPTVVEAAQGARPDPLREAAVGLAVRVERLADGCLVAILLPREGGADLAVDAARCALAMARAAPEAAVGIAIGPADVDDVPKGELIERVARIANGRGIHVDDVTVGLLRGRFQLEGDVLLGERTSSDGLQGVRRLTPFIGRERELSRALARATECADGAPQAIVITGPAGSGKSRLRHESVEAIRARHSDTIVLTAQADSVRAGAHLDVARQLVRAALREPSDLAAVDRRLEELGAGEDRGRVSSFLGELLGLGSPTPELPLIAARQNPITMGDQTRLAFEELLRYATLRHFVVIVVEDIHWSDVASVRWLEGALKRAGELRLFVIATARPEVHQAFPGVFSESSVTNVALQPLSTEASIAIAKLALGGDAATALRVAELAAGNPFFLEELIRNPAQTRARGAPDTVLAMLLGQLEALDPFARRVLRLASVLGRRSQRAGVASLLSKTEGAALDQAIELLVERDLLRRIEPDGLQFQHDLVREAAYASLTERDRSGAHRLVARWLANTRADPLELAEHLERGGQLSRAAEQVVVAAELALGANSLDRVVELSERAASLGATPELRARACLVAAAAHLWSGRYDASREQAERARALGEPNSALRYRATTELGRALTFRRDEAAARALARDLLDARPKDDVVASDHLHGLVIAARLAALLPDRALTTEALGRVEAHCKEHPVSPALVPAVESVRALGAVLANDFVGYVRHAALRRDAAAANGDLRDTVQSSSNLAFGLLQLGRNAEAEEVVLEAIAIGRRLGLTGAVALLEGTGALAMRRQGKLAVAIAALERSVTTLQAVGDRQHTAARAAELGECLRLSGSHAEARRYAELALSLADPLNSVYAKSVLSRIALDQGNVDEALSLSAAAHQLRDAVILRYPGEAVVDVAYAHALAASGREREARAVVIAGRVKMMERTNGMNEDDVRRLLTDVPENAELEALHDRLV